MLHAGQWHGARGAGAVGAAGLAARGPPLAAGAAGRGRCARGRARPRVHAGAGSRPAPYWADLRERLAGTHGGPRTSGAARGGRAATLVAARGDVGADATAPGTATGRPGTWRAPPDALLVWDWERFATGVPVGFDALHYELQRRIAGRRGRRGPAVEATGRGRPPALLAPFGVDRPGRAEVTALLYLVDLAARYLADRQAEAGARLGVLGTWLLPVLMRQVAAVEE